MAAGVFAGGLRVHCFRVVNDVKVKFLPSRTAAFPAGLEKADSRGEGGKSVGSSYAVSGWWAAHHIAMLMV